MFLDQLRVIADRCPGARGLSLVGSDGLPLASLPLDDAVDVEMLAAETVSLAQAARDNHEEFGAGPLRCLVLETDEHVLLLGEAGDDVYLFLVVDGHHVSAADVARSRFELRRAVLDLAPALRGDADWTVAAP